MRGIILFVTLVAMLASVAMPAKADEKTASGSGAIALAALLGVNSPLLNERDKGALADALDGKAGFSFLLASHEISISVDSVTCRASNVDIVAHSCDLKFGDRTVTISGRSAHELFATLIEIGVSPEGAAGSEIEALTKLDCSIKLDEVKQKSGGGADCHYTAD